MILFCERCGSEMHPLSAYCCYCSAHAPARTVFGDFSDPVYENGTHCAACGKQGPEDSAFCGACSESLFKKPSGQLLYCPSCGEKNKIDAGHCIKCRASFANWYSMRGRAAKKLGFSGDLVLKEKMNGVTFVFITGEKGNSVTFGRSLENDIVIPCGWVSSSHCRIDMENKLMTDEGSSNGTYINRKSDVINQVGLNEIREFNISGSFTFSVINKPGVFIFRLTAILDEEECNKNGDPEGYEALRNMCYILCTGDQEIHIRKQDGMVDSSQEPQHDYYTIKIENGFYYYSDENRDIEDRLLFIKKANWPVNWVVGE